MTGALRRGLYRWWLSSPFRSIGSLLSWRYLAREDVADFVVLLVRHGCGRATVSWGVAAGPGRSAYRTYFWVRLDVFSSWFGTTMVGSPLVFESFEISAKLLCCGFVAIPLVFVHGRACCVLLESAGDMCTVAGTSAEWVTI